MLKTLRTILIGMLVIAMSFNPAAAWFFNRGGCGGYGGCGYGGWGGYGHYYSSYYGGGYGGCGYYGGYYRPVVHNYSYCGGGYCGGGYCGGWDSYGDCGSCGDCGCGSYDGGVVESYDSMPEYAPAAPAEEPAAAGQRMPRPQMQEPSRVQRPMDTTPVPMLPAEPMPRATQPPVTPPAEQPMPPADDLFNGTETTTPPAQPPAEEPNDLFGTPTEPAEPTPPAETEPSDDLFGTPPAEKPTPTEGATPAEPSEPADDLFGTPTNSTPAEGAAPTNDGSEEMPADTTEETPAEEAPVEGEEGTGNDDIFGTSSGVILREPGGLASNELRTWVDNTGSYSCRGRLIRFLDGRVRLLKDNGRTTTVPLYRLSASDLSFVHRQASAQQASVAGQLAQSFGALPLLAN